MMPQLIKMIIAKKIMITKGRIHTTVQIQRKRVQQLMRRRRKK
jgi:hypothetical protein